MSLETRAKWAKRIAAAVRPILKKNDQVIRWTVPAASGASGMEYHTVERHNGHFRCWLNTPLNPSGIPCKGNRVEKAGVCRHVMAVCAHELEKQGRTVQFRHPLDTTSHLHRAGFRLRGEAGSLYVTHRKGE